jgi:hypothetical protein
VRLQDVTLRSVKPGNDNYFIAYRKTVKSLRNRRIQLDPGIWSAFVSLPGRFVEMFERRMNEANGIK